jgi:hypothetical protein
MNKLWCGHTVQSSVIEQSDAHTPNHREDARIHVNRKNAGKVHPINYTSSLVKSYKVIVTEGRDPQNATTLREAQRNF